MKCSTKDKVEGAVHELKGNAKAVAGKMTGNLHLEAEGTVEKLSGKLQKKVGAVKKVLGK